MTAKPTAIRRSVELASHRAPSPQPWPRGHRGARYARLAKYVLPIAAVALAAVILAWARINPVIDRLQLSETELAPQEIDAITMENARFAGTDAENRAFDVTAARAVQSAEDADRIDLQQPRAVIALASGTRISIEAAAGALQRSSRLLDLSGGITIVQDEGYRFRTSRAQIDLENRTASGDAAVDGSGPDGEIRADGFQIFDEGARVIFTGRSYVVLRSRQEAAQP